MAKTRHLKSLVVAAGLLGLAACEGDEAGEGQLSEAPAVPLVNSSGEIIGEVRGGDSDQGATLLVTARGLPPGEHGMHLHEIGICETPDFTSAGPHWNPTGAQHGFEDPQGPHAGDLRNVTVGPDGNLRAEVTIADAFLRTAGRDVGVNARQILDASGAALVIHAQPDDYRTNPSGDSGDRIACAELGEPAPGAVINPEGAGNATDSNMAANVTDGNLGVTEPTPGQNTFANLDENSVIVNMDTSPPNPR